MFLFFGREATKDEFDIAKGGTEAAIVSAKTKTWKIGATEMASDGFESIIATTGAFGAIADFSEWEVEVIANYKDIARGDFVKIKEFTNGMARFVIKGLRFDEESVAIFEPEGVKFRFLPVEMVDFGIKIKGEEAEIMPSEVVFGARVAETDDEFHDEIIT